MQRLVDLVESFRVYAVCAPCGRMDALDACALVSSLGPAVTVADVRARLRCRVCGQRSHDLRIVYVGPKDRPVVGTAEARGPVAEATGYRSSVASSVSPKPLTPT